MLEYFAISMGLFMPFGLGLLGCCFGVLGAISTLTLARLHSTLTPCRVLIRNRLGAISESAGDFDGGEGVCACGVVVVAPQTQKKPKLDICYLL
jgi:hypothetical protein